jgi:hypothetical protein
MIFDCTASPPPRESLCPYRNPRAPVSACSVGFPQPFRTQCQLARSFDAPRDQRLAGESPSTGPLHHTHRTEPEKFRPSKKYKFALKQLPKISCLA